jgi:uncharacterized protein
MLLDLSKIRGTDDRVDRTFEASALGTSEDYIVAGPVRLGADVHKDKDRYQLTGRVQAPLDLVCSRCLETFRLDVDAQFDLSYVPHVENVGEGEVAIEEDDLSTAYYRDDAIDLGQLVREQCYLALPMKPLCSENCKGLCPTCGTNWNTATCNCTTEWEDPRLAPLKRLVEKNEFKD